MGKEKKPMLLKINHIDYGSEHIKKYYSSS